MIFDPIELACEVFSTAVEVWAGKKPVAFLGCFVVLVAAVILVMALVGW